jgi:hypothetical protein
MRYCGHAAVLSAQYPQASVHSVRGDLVHLACQAAEVRTTTIHEAYRMALASVDEDVRVEVVDMVGRWLEVRKQICPEHVDVEVEMALDADGVPCPIDSPDAFVTGHADICWTEGDVAIVGDYKTGQPKDSAIQVGTYGLAYSAMKGLTKFKTAIIYLQPGKDPDIRWSPVIEGDAAEVLWQQIVVAAGKGPEPVVGPHCESCFQRPRCRSWMTPALELAHEALRPFDKADGLTLANAPRALRVVLAMEDAIKIAKGRLRTLADEHGGIPDGSGKIWKGRQVAGQTAVDVDALYEKYSKRGDGYTAYSWGKK